MKKYIFSLMKTRLFSLLIVLMVLIIAQLTFLTQVEAAQKADKGKQKGVRKAEHKVAQKKRSQLSTDVRFSGTDVSGKYQSPAEAVTTIENEKQMLNLIEPRYEFTDRLRKSVSQR